jgi:hypothetical protein
MIFQKWLKRTIFQFGFEYYFYLCQLNVFFKYTLLVWNLRKIFFSSTINISFAKVAISTEFLLATSEIQSSMATFSTNTEYHISVILKFSCIFTKNVLNSSGILWIDNDHQIILRAWVIINYNHLAEFHHHLIIVRFNIPKL